VAEKNLNLEDDLETPAAVEPEIVAEEDTTAVLQEKLSQALDEVTKHKEQYLRTLADMENLRKRTQRDKEDLAKYANENILREILPVIDNLERAVEHVEQAGNEDGLF